MSEKVPNRVDVLFTSLFDWGIVEQDKWLSANMLLAMNNPILSERERKEYLTDLITVYSLFAQKRKGEMK